MSTLIIITLSLVGAILFVAGGFLIARSTKRPDDARSEDLLRELSQRERDASRRVAELEQQAAANSAAYADARTRAEQEAASLRHALAQAEHALSEGTSKKAEAARVADHSKLEEAKRAIERVTRELTSAQTRAHQLEQELAASQTRRKQLEQELATVKPRTKQLELELADAGPRLRQLEQDLARATSSTRGLEQERSRLTAALKEQEDVARGVKKDLEQVTGALTEAQTKAGELSLDGVLSHERTKNALGRIAELETELTALRTDSADRDNLRQRLTDATTENQRLRAQLFATESAAKPARAVARVSASTAPRVDGKAPLSSMHGDVLQGLVERIAELKDVRSVALTDALGFVVAATGEHPDELAAFGAFLSNVGTRAETLLPFDAAREVLVRDKNGVVLMSRTLEPDLALVTLGVGEAPPGEVTRILNTTTDHPHATP